MLARAAAVGVERFVCPALDLFSTRQALKLAQTYPSVIAGAGLHPLSGPEPLELFDDLVVHSDIELIGEVGTDVSAGEWSAQATRLRYFLELAGRVDKPTVIHIRGTWDKTRPILSEYPHLRRKAVIHCFSGGPRQADAMADLGLCLSVTALLARRGMESSVEVIKKWPLEDLLLETDGPWLPWPKVASQNIFAQEFERLWAVDHRADITTRRPTEPAVVGKIAAFVAFLKRTTPSEVAKQTDLAARRLFRGTSWADLSEG